MSGEWGWGRGFHLQRERLVFCEKCLHWDLYRIPLSTPRTTSRCQTARLNHYVVTTRIRLFRASVTFFGAFGRINHNVDLDFCRVLSDAKEKKENDDSFLELTPPIS